MERTEHGHYIPNDTLSTHGRPTISYNFSCSKFQNMNILVPINEDLNLMVYKVYSRIPVWLMPSPPLTSQVMACHGCIKYCVPNLCVASWLLAVILSYSMSLQIISINHHQPLGDWKSFSSSPFPAMAKKSSFPKRSGGNSQPLVHHGQPPKFLTFPTKRFMFQFHIP